MEKPNPKTPKRLSLAPLTPEQAIAAVLQVKKSDVDKLEAEERAKNAKAKRKK